MARSMHDKLFEAAPGMARLWYVAGVELDESTNVLSAHIDCETGNRFAAEGFSGEHPVHDTVTKTYRHLNFFQHEYHLLVHTPPVKLPDGPVQPVKPSFGGRLAGCTQPFAASILKLAPQMPFAAVACIVGESACRVMAVCRSHVGPALEAASFIQVKALAIDATARSRGHGYITLAADAFERRELSVTAGRDAAFIKGCTEDLPKARITFDKFHVIWHGNAAVDKTRRIEQRGDKELKGLRWALMKDRADLKPEAAADLDALIARMMRVRTARAWVYKEQWREILERKPINVARQMLRRWCTCVMRSKVEPMKDVAALARRRLQGIVDRTQTRQTNGFLEAHNGLFQAAERRARGFTRMETIKTVIFLIAGKLDFAALNPRAR